MVIVKHSFQKVEQSQPSGGKEVFQKKSLGRRWHLMSSPVKGCEFSVRYVWNGAGARFRWKTSFPVRTSVNLMLFTQILFNLFYSLP